MDSKKINFALLSLMLALTGCATGDKPWHSDWRNCAMAAVPAGAVVAGAGAAAADDGDDDDETMFYSAAGGAVVGGLLCYLFADDSPDTNTDTDGDGVPDLYDECPGTPAGTMVDERGCGPMDYDRDGVMDNEDRCPNTPLGETVDQYGCTLDSDGDGVPDSKDLCPNTPAGMAVNSSGCPLDSDGDGVTDGMDQCPNTPPNTPVNEIGCELNKAMVLEGILFEFDSAKLMPQSHAILDNTVRVLKQHPGLEIEIVGHTDSVGNAAYNQTLSARRAETVRKYLVSHGVSAATLSSSGRGESEPVANNSTESGRAMNRRVEMRTPDAR